MSSTPTLRSKCPPWRWAMALAMASPSPEPLAWARPLKKRSPARASSSAVMPRPLSMTRNTACGMAVVYPCQVSMPACTVTLAPSGVWCKALCSKLLSASLSNAACPITQTSPWLTSRGSKPRSICRARAVGQAARVTSCARATRSHGSMRLSSASARARDSIWLICRRCLLLVI